MRSTCASHLTLLAVAVAMIHLPSSAVSGSMVTTTEQGPYLCNLCHSRQNDHPYPPPDAEDTVVQFTQSQAERFGMPVDRGTTCLEVWDTVLDYANPSVTDEASCRSMAEAYAPQCCNDSTDDEAVDEPRGTPTEEQQESNEEQGVVGAIPSIVESSSITMQSATISYLRG